ncbi:hypothetical protein LZD49_31620 [Dyadobacter sp. CY261]|uniref:hypothetical protein n=1 Tax=Dyadobacter sp. CY261 TaxID=2907203 RepID=UPI001F26BBCE|nr:hypothetical protein [Dyadobacter sp. CY261]MCF0075076.1 hypothetical protein [Dyadobacter sp. CY261]
MRLLYRAFLVLLVLQKAHAQETLYWANGSNFPYKLVASTENTLKVGETRGDRLLARTVPRENVIVAFNAKGNFLPVSSLSKDPTRSLQQIEQFYSSAGPSYDLLIAAEPVRIVECNISYKSEHVINFTTISGASGSINRKDLALIIYKNGIHEFVRSPSESAGILEQAAPLVAQAILLPGKMVDSVSTTQAVVLNEAIEVKKGPDIKQRSDPADGPGQIDSISTDTESAKVALTQTQTTGEQPSTQAEKPGLSTEDVAAYSIKGIRKVDEFVQYLNVISDKSIDPDKKDEAIEQATKLFLSEATIEVTSSNREGKRRYRVKDYLTRLKLLPYSATKIAWNEVNYIKDLVLESDGSYYGTITGTQTFTGFDTNGQDIVYSDVTKKNVKVKLQSYQKAVEGQQTTNWEILLGNIGISTNP